jgi:4-hydroxy-4-methyl-2-oxoglutarate aldolase
MSSTHSTLSDKQLEDLRKFDTCTISNAIERLNVRPRTEGFVSGAVTCRFPQLQPVIGYAVTATMRSSMIPVKGHCYFEHPDFWRYVAGSAGPTILVIQDADHSPGVGALCGEAYARISRALGGVACLTNGAVRDLPAVEALGFQLFAGNVSVSHAYAHIVDFGQPVEIAGLHISSGDLLHGDLHGVQMIPLGAAAELPVIAEKVLRDDRELAELTCRQDFSMETLAARLEGVNRHLL